MEYASQVTLQAGLYFFGNFEDEPSVVNDKPPLSDIREETASQWQSRCWARIVTARTNRGYSGERTDAIVGQSYKASPVIALQAKWYPWYG